MNTNEKSANELLTINTEEYGVIQVFGAAKAFTSPVIVEKSVVTRLAALLPRSNFKDIKNDFREDLRRVNNMEEFVELLQTELSFHRTVNIIKDVEIADAKAIRDSKETGVKEVGKIDLNPDLTEKTIAPQEAV